MKSKIALAAVAVAALVSLSACSSGASANGSNKTTNLTWAMWISGSADQAGWQKIADEVHTEDPSLTVTLQGAPGNDYWTKIGPELASDEAPCIVSTQSNRLSQLANGLLPLDDLIKKNHTDLSGFDKVALEGMQLNGKTYGLPYDSGPVIMFYNKDMFAQAGVPTPGPNWTVSQFEDDARKLAAAGHPLFANTSEDLYDQAMTLSYNGGTATDDQGKIDPTNKAWEAGVDWIGSLTKNGWATVADGADGSADDNAFMTGTVGAEIAGPWALIDLASKTTFPIGAVTLPTGTGGPNAGKTYSAGSGFAISAKCATPDAAFKALTIMTDQKSLSILAKDGRAFPARTAAQPDWLAKASDVTNIGPTLDAAQERSIPMRSSSQSQQFSQLLAQYGTAAINGKESASSAMAQISSQMGS